LPLSGLQDALLVLPFSKVSVLLEHLDYWAKREWNITLVSRILFSILRMHHSQIVATGGTMRTTLLSLKTNLRESLRRQKETIGYNLAALKFLKRQQEASRTAEFFEDSGFGGVLDEQQIKEKIAEGAKKRKRISLRV